MERLADRLKETERETQRDRKADMERMADMERLADRLESQKGRHGETGRKT